MKKILLTGGSGMVGRNILEHANCASLEIDAPSRSELDLSDTAATEAYVKQNQPDVLIHAAGLVGGIQANIANPVDYLVKNVDIGRNILLAAKNSAVKRVINIASSCMYPRNIDRELEEALLLCGELEPTNEGYALAKIFSTRLCQYINREQGYSRFKTLIPCNLYGRFDNFDPETSHLIPAIIQKVHSAKTTKKNSVEVWGDGNARREFMYAGDFADAVHHMIAHFDSADELMNIGLSQDHSITDYYQSVADALGWNGALDFNTDKPVGMKRKKVCTQKQNIWGWSATTPLEAGIEKTYAYYLEHISHSGAKG